MINIIETNTCLTLLSVTLDNVRYIHKKLRVLSFSINHSVCFYYIDFRLFYVNMYDKNER